MEAVLVAAVLIAYNNALNRWPPFRGPLYVPANLALSTGVLLLAGGPLGLDAESIGVGGGQAGDLLLGAGLGAAASAPLFLALRSKTGAEAIADRRMQGMAGRELVWRCLVRVPLGTALPEELVFRGVLYALMEPAGAVSAAVWSSIAFGFWHIAPTYNLLEENGQAASGRPTVVAAKVATGVLLTGVAGLVLVWLRTLTGGLAAPFGFHAALNSLGTVAAALAGRRTRGSTPGSSSP
ncbi:MAG TPA: CPBP family intramembrane glutamic endopeptidase [Actinomycetota bacterium]|nr:CPBP family intramembrane glutamic endopeptidase [Actinomycetota bacterium]